MNKLNLSLLTTALIACGYSNFAVASNKFTQTVEQNPTEQVEQSYYEDSEGFDAPATFQGNGWGWTNAGSKQANLVECTTDCSTVVECTSSASTCTQESSTETLTMLDVEQAQDQTSPFNTTVESHIAWAIVNDFNKDYLG